MMKNIFKIALAVAFVCSTAVASAQKVGRVNVQEIILGMPEMTAMQQELETIQKDFQDNLETMQVELNTKFQEFQQQQATMNASIKALKEKDMQDLSQRMQQFEQTAGQEIQRKQAELLDPIIKKAREAVAAEAKAGSYTLVMDESNGSMAYFDPAVVVDLSPAVKTRLGVK